MEDNIITQICFRNFHKRIYLINHQFSIMNKYIKNIEIVLLYDVCIMNTVRFKCREETY